MSEAQLVVGEPMAGGESGNVWHGTLDGSVPVVVKRGEVNARPRFEALASMLDRLRDRGAAVPAIVHIEADDGGLLVAQSLLPGTWPEPMVPAAYVEDVVAASALLADVEDVPTIRGVAWPALLRHSLVLGEDEWCRHEPMREHSSRTRRLVEHAEACGAGVDVASVPSTDVVHLDLHPANTLVDRSGRLSGIVDWEGALPGDRHFDLLYFAHHVDVWREDAATTAAVYDLVEASVPSPLLGAYAAHVALRTVEWQVSRHTAADVERWLGPAERLVARYP